MRKGTARDAGKRLAVKISEDNPVLTARQGSTLLLTLLVGKYFPCDDEKGG